MTGQFRKGANYCLGETEDIERNGYGLRRKKGQADCSSELRPQRS